MNESLEGFYENLQGADIPWEVKSVKRDSKNHEVLVTVQLKPNFPFVCPVCGENAKKYDQVIRRWRHHDPSNCRTLIEGPIPRVKCPEHGVKQIPVSWAKEKSRFTIEFESFVLDRLKDNSVLAVAMDFGLSWDVVNGILRRSLR